MDWLQILATSQYWFEGLFIGMLPYAFIGRYNFCVAWACGWIFLGTSANAGYTAFAIVLLVLFLQSSIRGWLFVTTRKGIR